METQNRINFRSAAVIGAGTMGAAVAAHLANAGLRVLLLDIVPGELLPEEQARDLALSDIQVRNRLAVRGLQAAAKSRPANFFTPELAALIQTGNLEDDFEALKEVDWIIEAIVENLAIKQDLMARLDRVRAPHAVVSTNTSGLPVHSITAECSEPFRRHFLGTHFFNPPRYLQLLELIPGPDTEPEVLAYVSDFCESRLGKGVVVCKDTPNFIANRIGTVQGAIVLDYVLENGLGVKEVDSITGPLVGRPKTATFRLLDLVGIDVWELVRRNLAQAIPDDAFAQRYLNAEKPLELQKNLVDRGWIGNKAGQGFYKAVRENGATVYHNLNLETFEYEAPPDVRYESVGKAKDLEELPDRLRVMLAAEDPAGDLIRLLVYGGLAYASHCIPEVADNPAPIDQAVRLGFRHEAGPFEIWDELGVAETAEHMTAAGFKPADWVRAMLGAGFSSFFEYKYGRPVGAFNPVRSSYDALEDDPSVIILKARKQAGAIIDHNPSATLLDLGDGVACVEFHTKMNVLDTDIGLMVDQSLDRVEREFEGLVIGNDAENFSAGANLGLIVLNAQAGQWDQLRAIIRGLQELHMRMRYFSRPVVVAPAGITLGGGAEMLMHASRVVAHAELYTGLVETGMGLIPAAGGTKEMLRRIVNPPLRTQNASSLAYLQRVLEQVGQVKVATSAVEAQEMGLLTPADRIVMNREQLLAEAKREVLHLAKGYRPPVPEKIYAVGRDGLAALQIGVYTLREGGFITEYEARVGRELIRVMTGGEISQAAWVDEQYILDLECEAFLSLCGEAKTQERIWHFLQTGKPLRN